MFHLYCDATCLNDYFTTFDLTDFFTFVLKTHCSSYLQEILSQRLKILRNVQ